MPETREEKIRRLKQKLALVMISLVNAKNKLNEGHVVNAAVIEELSDSEHLLEEQIKKIEEQTEEAPGSGPSSSQPASSGPAEPGAAGASLEDAEETRKDELVERMILRPRRYTMTEKARKQRSNAAQSTAHNKALMGNKNAWKTGQFAQGFIRQLFRPCLSSCPNYPCELIDDGESALGHDCPDKAEFIKGLSAIQKAMRTGDLTDLKEIAALRIAGNFELLGNIQQELMATRGVVLSEKLDKEGNVIGHEMKPHPLFLVLPKLTEVTKATASDFMMTPLEIKRQKTEAKKAKALSNFLSDLGMGEAPGDEEEVDQAAEEGA